MVEAMQRWKRCRDWRKGDGEFILALDRWIKERRWENVPDDVKKDPMALYRQPRKNPDPTPPEGEAASPEDIAEFMRQLSKVSKSVNADNNQRR